MNEEKIMPEKQLEQIRDAMYQEWAQLQVAGCGLSSEEMQRADALGQAVELLDEALAVLSGEVGGNKILTGNVEKLDYDGKTD